MFSSKSTPNFGSHSSSGRIDYQFIVVYDKFCKPVAKSILNQACELSIHSTAWSPEQYLYNEPRLNNDNHVLFLSEKLLEENLSNPSLKAHPLLESAKYKTQGNAVGIYVEDCSYAEAANRLGDSLKEDWLMQVGVLIGGGLIGGSLFAAFRYYSKKRKAKLYLLFKAADKFTREKLQSFVAGKLHKA